MAGFGIIGCGTIADFHIEAIRGLSGARLAAVSSRNATKAKAVAERENCAWTADYETLLQRTDIDIVCVTTSSGSHYSIGRAALTAGKHVVIEKPVAMRAAEAEELCRLAAERGLTLSVISQRRFEPLHREAKRILEEGRIGKLLLAEAEVPFYRSQQYYDSAPWRGTIAEDGGALMNQGIHAIDLLLWLAGEARSVYGRTATQTHAMEAEDLGVAIVQFKSGALGTIMASTSITPGFPASIRLYGSEGAIKLEGSGVVHWTVPGYEAPPAFESSPAYGGVSDPRSISHLYHQLQLQNVIEAIASGSKPVVTGEDGYRAVQLIEAIYESSAAGGEIRIHPLAIL
ncbi:Gfo/Idh/MocA family oxidoreductase [Paenibacillus rhizovicinus]|uniref:Gfo/Idh/MocA family oxidoreductase n=1 Tax=Paenibacillus rhizovicinus TaxID=2704463 RepID=A0A6C0NYY7_9BACL|nr:Gfo/Idh/MocA family oxidoreductase [Paenibacillus rhizovicinus]QHW31419.1 Gfo/Idh/MocA family oxidoreductase [Paenibacillus rhizovicinus]